MQSSTVCPVSLDEERNALVLLDQTELPGQKVFLTLTNREDIWESIYKLRVRGAPAIGIAAAYGVYVCVAARNPKTTEELERCFKESREYLLTARPTAVNLSWALSRMEARLRRELKQGGAVDTVLAGLREEAHRIREEDAAVCRRIGEHGLGLLTPGCGILTHCNAGRIATADYGTALGPIYVGLERGISFRVYADETRPLLQGARLTAWELQEAGVDVTLICDNMAAAVMAQGKIDAVLVGCDRVAANGDAANKIGTHGVAILAKHFGIPFYVCAPKSTIDLNCPTGKEIQIEERPGEEITSLWYEKPMAPRGVKTYNPAFDVTPASLITAIITEDGVLRAPFEGLGR